MTVLVTGANGQLGCWLRLAVAGSAAASLTAANNYFSCGCSKNQFPSSVNALALAAGEAAAEPGFRFLFTDISDLSAESRGMLQKLGGEGVDLSTARLDVTDLAAVREMVKNEGVGAIVNCAGFTNVDAAESQPEAAELLNAKAPENLAVAMREVNGLLVHVSTDYVFGGTPCDSPIPEDFPPAPLGAYGWSKLHGEEAIRRVGCRSVILRTAWLFSEFGKNFVRTMLRLTAERPQLKVVDDQRGTPTYAADLAATILQILSVAASPAALSASDENYFSCGCSKNQFPSSVNAHALAAGEAGVFNYTNAGECTWYEFACAIAEAAGRTGCEILPCRSEEFPSPVRRPAYSVLDKSRIRAALGLEIPEWRDGLRRCLASLL